MQRCIYQKPWKLACTCCLLTVLMHWQCNVPNLPVKNRSNAWLRGWHLWKEKGTKLRSWDKFERNKEYSLWLLKLHSILHYEGGRGQRQGLEYFSREYWLWSSLSLLSLAIVHQMQSAALSSHTSSITRVGDSFTLKRELWNGFINSWIYG